MPEGEWAATSFPAHYHPVIGSFILVKSVCCVWGGTKNRVCLEYYTSEVKVTDILCHGLSTNCSCWVQISGRIKTTLQRNFQTTVSTTRFSFRASRREMNLCWYDVICVWYDVICIWHDVICIWYVFGMMSYVFGMMQTSQGQLSETSSQKAWDLTRTHKTVSCIYIKMLNQCAQLLSCGDEPHLSPVPWGACLLLWVCKNELARGVEL